MLAQLGRHDIEHVSAHAEDRDEIALGIGAAQNTERGTGELLDAEQLRRTVTRRQHLGPAWPILVEFERLGIGGATHGAIAGDDANILDGAPLIDGEPHGLERRSAAVH